MADSEVVTSSSFTTDAATVESDVVTSPSFTTNEGTASNSNVVTSSSFTTDAATINSDVVTSGSFTTASSTSPLISNGPFNTTHNAQITLQGENLDLATSVTYAGISVAIDSQTAIELVFTVLDAYANGLGFGFTHFIVVSNDSGEEATTQNTLAAPAGTHASGEITGYDTLSSSCESWFDDTTISVVDGDHYITFNPNSLTNLVTYASGAFDSDVTGDFTGRVLDVSGTEGPDGTWTELRTVSIVDAGQHNLDITFLTGGITFNVDAEQRTESQHNVDTAFITGGIDFDVQVSHLGPDVHEAAAEFLTASVNFIASIVQEEQIHGLNVNFETGGVSISATAEMSEPPQYDVVAEFTVSAVEFSGTVQHAEPKIGDGRLFGWWMRRRRRN